jgi:hypothetical protein
MSELWNDVIGYEGLYEVSSTGKIRNKKRGKLRKLYIEHKGYVSVTLKRKGLDQKGMKVHRLVAMAFIPNPEMKPHVNHKDGDKTNNNDWNLEWCTISENAIHAFKLGLRKPTEAQRQAIIKFNKERIRKPTNPETNTITPINVKYDNN